MSALLAVAGARLWPVARLRVLRIAQAIATTLVVIAALEVRRTGSFARQMDWAVLAVAGLALAAIVGAMWVLTGRRLIGWRRESLGRAAADLFATPEATPTDQSLAVATPVMTHYHRPECQLVRGKSVASGSVREHEQAQRTPCAVCRP